MSHGSSRLPLIAHTHTHTLLGVRESTNVTHLQQISALKFQDMILRGEAKNRLYYYYRSSAP